MQILFSGKEKQLIIDALEEMLYRIAMDMEKLKGGPMDRERKRLDKLQKRVEDLLFKIDNM